MLHTHKTMNKVLSLLSLLLLFSWVNAGDEYAIDKATVNATGGISSGSNYQIKSSTGQPDASNLIGGGGFIINGGIWTPQNNSDIIFINGFEQ